MKIIELRHLFDAGALMSMTISPYMGKWVGTVKPLEGDPITIHAKRGGVRQFITIQAGLNAGRDIGFDKVAVTGLLTQ